MLAVSGEHAKGGGEKAAMAVRVETTTTRGSVKRPAPPPGRPRGASLPPGWEAHATEDGTPYFYNTNTGETAWDAPVERV